VIVDQTDQGHSPPPGWYRVVTAQLNLLDGRLGLIEQEIHQLKEMAIMAQSDIDALTTEVTNLASTLAGDVTSIQTEIAALEQQVANGQPVDLTGITAAVAALSGTVGTVSALVPAPPAPPAP
jgi:hypothetical protein